MNTISIDNVKHSKKFIYFLMVYCLPFLCAVGLGLAVFYLAANNYLIQYDEFYSYLIIVLILFFSINIFKRAYIKMPNKKLYKIKNLQLEKGFLFIVPKVYEIEYFNKKAANVSAVIFGLILIAIGYMLLLFTSFSYVMPIFIMLVGLLALVFNFIVIFNKYPVLKLSQHGLWTKQLNFVDWKDVEKIETKIVGKLFSKKNYLLIYLSKSYFNTANLPDQYLLIQHIKGNSYIETVAINLMRNRKENLISNLFR